MTTTRKPLVSFKMPLQIQLRAKVHVVVCKNSEGLLNGQRYEVSDDQAY